MVDPLMLGAIGIPAALTLREQVNRILGPTSDYLGEKLCDLIKLRQKNVERIINKTEEILGDKVEEPGIINPRIIERLVNSGSYIEDDLVQNYFAGVMASSRTSTGNDDRGLYLLDLVIKMSNTDLKAHYILYKRMREKHLRTQYSIFKVEDRHRLACTISVNQFFTEFRKYYKDTFDEVGVLTEFIPRLLKEELLNDCVFGPKIFCSERKREWFTRKSYDVKPRAIESLGESLMEEIERRSRHRSTLFGYGLAQNGVEDVTDGNLYLVYTPSPLGAQLYLWVHGEGHRLANEIFNPSLNFKDISLT